MAQVTITIPDTLLPRVVAAYGVASGAALKTYVINQMKAKLADYEAQQAAATADTTARTTANTDATGIT